MFHASLLRRRPRRAGVALAALFLAALFPIVKANAAPGVDIQKAEGKLRIEVDGEFFSEYVFGNTSRPYLYPLLLPGGKHMSRDWPMKDTPGEEHDHPHHKSLWWAHGDMNGQDFWSEGTKAGKTEQTKLVSVQSGPEAGEIKTENQYVAKDGKIIATDERTITIRRATNARVIDYFITVHASNGELRFGDTKEGTMAVRLAESMRLIRDKKPGEGHIVNSEGVKDGDTWGKRAKWVDYFGPVDGETVGVAMFDHPSNPRFPTWWHVRDYGLFAANPFGVHDFEKKPAGAGDLVVPRGKSITFTYRFYFHRGDDKQAHVAEQYEAFVNAKIPTPSK